MKTTIVNYLKLLLSNMKEKDRYYDLLGEISLLDTLYNTEEYIGQLLGIPQEILDYVVFEYIYQGYISNEIEQQISDPEEVADYIIKLMEGNK